MTESIWPETQRAAPAEFVTHGGDCEDYAIAKFVALRALGFGDDEMQIVALYDPGRGEYHAVLAVRAAGRSMLLDNRTNRILSLDEVRGYRPIFSVNESGWWPHRS